MSKIISWDKASTGGDMTCLVERRGNKIERILHGKEAEKEIKRLQKLGRRLL